MSRFRNPTAWPRSIKVNGVEMHLTDRETNALLDALNAWRAQQEMSGKTHSVAGLAHFVATGRLPDESPAVRAWRVAIADEQPRRESQPDHVDAASTLWRDP